MHRATLVRDNTRGLHAGLTLAGRDHRMTSAHRCLFPPNTGGQLLTSHIPCPTSRRKYRGVPLGFTDTMELRCPRPREPIWGTRGHAGPGSGVGSHRHDQVGMPTCFPPPIPQPRSCITRWRLNVVAGNDNACVRGARNRSPRMTILCGT